MEIVDGLFVEKQVVGEVEQGLPVVEALLVATLTIVDSNFIPSSQKVEHLFSGLVRLLGSFRVRPVISESFRGEEGSRGDKGFESVLT